MEKEAFERFIGEMSDYFERKDPSDETMQIWFEDLQHLSPDALSHLRERFVRLETWPRNLPGYLLRVYQEWVAAHPSWKQSTTECRQCVDGYLSVARSNGDAWDVFRFPCECSHTRGFKWFALAGESLYQDRSPDYTAKHLGPRVFIHPRDNHLMVAKLKRGELLEDLPF